MIKVTLLTYTPEPEKVIAAAAKLCYSHSDAATLYDGLDEDKTTSFLERLTNLGHASPTEHATFTFAIDGISRACSHQLVRHRLASYSQQSQRYVKMDNSYEYVVPPAVMRNTELLDWYLDKMESYYDDYTVLQEELQGYYMDDGLDRAIAEKKANEDARYLLPNAAETKIVVSMNARELLHFFNVRCCNRSQWEIREVADQMLRLVKPIAPTLFKYAGPNCLYGMCSEGRMCCGTGRKPEEFE